MGATSAYATSAQHWANHESTFLAIDVPGLYTGITIYKLGPTVNVSRILPYIYVLTLTCIQVYYNLWRLLLRICSWLAISMWLTKHWPIYLVSRIALPHGRAPSSLGSLTHDTVHLVFMSMAPSAADLVSQVALTAMDLASQVWLPQRKVTSVAPSAVDSLVLGIALPIT